MIVLAILLALAFFAIAVTLSSLVASITVRAKKKPNTLPAFFAQMLFIATALTAAYIMGDISILGSLKSPLHYLIAAIGSGIALGILAYGIGKFIDSTCSPPLNFENPLEMAILLIVLAPIGEELLFRGLIEGYLLENNVGVILSILVPAILFGFMHVIAFLKTSVKCTVAVASLALILGLIAG